jgi:hypothetical protein
MDFGKRAKGKEPRKKTKGKRLKAKIIVKLCLTTRQSW